MCVPQVRRGISRIVPVGVIPTKGRPMLYKIKLKDHPFETIVDITQPERVVHLSDTMSKQLDRAMRRLIDKHDITVPYDTEDEDITPVYGSVFKMEAVDGELKETYWTAISAIPSRARLMDEQFGAAQSKALEDLPTEFHAFIRQNAWEHGHSAGFEEVLNYVRELVHGLGPAIAEYDRNNGVR